MSSLILLAASGLGREVLNAVEAAGRHRVIGFLDDEAALHGTSVNGVPVLGPIEDAVRYTDAPSWCARDEVSPGGHCPTLGIWRDFV